MTDTAKESKDYGRASEALPSSEDPHVVVTERWQSQTLKGGADVPPNERGDCFRACVASILDEPIESLPNPHDNWDEGWFDAMRERGLQMVEANIEHWYPDGYWIAQLPSLNLPGCMHVVVMRGGDLIHDPGLTKRYTDGDYWKAGRGSVTRGWTIAPLDIATRGQDAEPNATTTRDPKPNPPDTATELLRALVGRIDAEDQTSKHATGEPLAAVDMDVIYVELAAARDCLATTPPSEGGQA